MDAELNVPVPNRRRIYAGVWRRTPNRDNAPSTTAAPSVDKHFALTTVDHIQNNVAYYRHDWVQDLLRINQWRHEDLVLPPGEGPNNDALHPSRYFMDGLINLGEVDWNECYGWTETVVIPGEEPKEIVHKGVLATVESQPLNSSVKWSDAQWIGYAIQQLSWGEVFFPLPGPAGQLDDALRGYSQLANGDREEFDAFRLRLEQHGDEIHTAMQAGRIGAENVVDFDWSVPLRDASDE